MVKKRSLSVIIVILSITGLISCQSDNQIFVGSTVTAEDHVMVTSVPTPFSDNLLSNEEVAQTLEIILDGDPLAVKEAVENVLQANDHRFIAVFIELLRAVEVNIHPAANYKLYTQALVQLTGQDFNNNFSDYFNWYGGTSLEPPPGFTEWKGRLLSGLDYRFLEFFQNNPASEIRVEEMLWGGVYLDGIPPLEHSPMIPAENQQYLQDQDLVFGIAINGDARAYPLKIMDWHEMANDTIGGTPVALAYCTLCGSGIAFKATLPDDTILDFSSSGFLYRSNKLMYDRQTKTLWNQLTGQPVLGKLAGQEIKLEILPLVLTDWGRWLEEHPDSLVLDIKTGYERKYENAAAYGDYFSSENTMFPVWIRSDRLDNKAFVYALQIEGIPKAYPVDLLVKKTLINDQIGETNIVLTAPNGINKVNGVNLRIGPVEYDSGAEIRVYERKQHVFTSLDQDRLLDEDGEIWEIKEDGLYSSEGELLTRVNGHLSYWFGWYAFFPQTLVYSENECIELWRKLY